jgi:hypothetical protein
VSNKEIIMQKDELRNYLNWRQRTFAQLGRVTALVLGLAVFKLSQSESGDAETKKREGGGLRRSR